MGRSAHAGIVARELGIAETPLYRWRSEQRQVESQGQTRQSMRAGRTNWHGSDEKTRR
jgi:transposase-like protein